MIAFAEARYRPWLELMRFVRVRWLLVTGELVVSLERVSIVLTFGCFQGCEWSWAFGVTAVVVGLTPGLGCSYDAAPVPQMGSAPCRLSTQ